MTDQPTRQQTTDADVKKATITLDSANSDPKYPAYQLSINAMTSETSGHGYRLMGSKYLGSSRNLRTVELTQRDADEIRAVLDEVFPQEQEPSGEAASLRSALAVIVQHSDMPETVRQEIRDLIGD